MHFVWADEIIARLPFVQVMSEKKIYFKKLNKKFMQRYAIVEFI